MALDTFQRESIARSAGGMLGFYSGRRAEDDRQIARRLIERAGITDFGEQVTVLNIVRQQRAAFAAGQALMGAGQGNKPSSPTVTDWATVDQPFQFNWRVEVVTVNRSTGDKTRRQIVISSGTPLTPNEIRQQAADAYASRPTTTNPRDRPVEVGDDTLTFTTILAAGRNPL